MNDNYELRASNLGDPDDPWAIMTTQIMKNVLKAAFDVDGVTIFREMPESRQSECIINGVLIALLLYCFTRVKRSSHDALLDYIATSLPVAARNADSLFGDAEQMMRERRR